MLAILAMAMTGVAASRAQDDPNLPKAFTGFPRWGDTPRVPEYSWVEVSYELVNPQPVPGRFRLTLRPEGEQGTVYVQIMAGGPQSRSSGDMLITAARSNEYESILTDERDFFLYQQSMKSEFQASYQKAGLFFIDDEELVYGVSELGRRDDLIRNAMVTRMPGSRTPRHWAAFGPAAVVALGNVEYQSLDALQYQALLDFVESGGTLLFFSPPGIMNARHTPLAPLLPVHPLRLREIEQLEFPADWLDAAAGAGEPAAISPVLRWSAGSARFLESSAKAGTVVTAQDGAFPVVAWRAYGLGRVVTIAVSPFEQVFRESAADAPFWNQLFCLAGKHPLTQYALHTEPVKAATRRLIGFRIPGAETVQMVLGGYLLLLVLVFGLSVIILRSGRVAICLNAAWKSAAVKINAATALATQASTCRRRTRPSPNTSTSSNR